MNTLLLLLPGLSFGLALALSWRPLAAMNRRYDAEQRHALHRCAVNYSPDYIARNPDFVVTPSGTMHPDYIGRD